MPCCSQVGGAIRGTDLACQAWLGERYSDQIACKRRCQVVRWPLSLGQETWLKLSWPHPVLPPPRFLLISSPEDRKRVMGLMMRPRSASSATPRWQMTIVR